MGTCKEENEECSPTYRVEGHEHFETEGAGWKCWQCATTVSAAVLATPETAPVGARVWRQETVAVTLTEEELTRIATALVIYASNHHADDPRFDSTMSALDKIHTVLDAIIPLGWL